MDLLWLIFLAGNLYASFRTKYKSARYLHLAVAVICLYQLMK